MKQTLLALRRRAIAALIAVAALPYRVSAQGFDKINTTITNINTILATISVGVVTIAIIWAGYKIASRVRGSPTSPTS